MTPSALSRQHVLVTGGTGFLGQHLVRRLRAEGCQVRVLVRPHQHTQDAARRDVVRHLSGLGAEIRSGDILDSDSLPAALQGITVVFHLAGKLLVPGVDEHVYERLHVDGTRHLLTACANEPAVRAIVHCSTTGVLGATGRTPASEDAPYRPGNSYERTKAAGERLALTLAQQHGLTLAVARPALVYGPGDLHLLGWFRAIQRGYYRVIGSGEALLHPVYIDDVIEGMMRCVSCDNTAGRVYHLVGERALPIRDLAASIAAALGKRLPRQRLPLPLALAVAAVLESLPGVPVARLPLTRQRILFMLQSRAYSGERASRELEFVPRIDLATGMRHTVAWYRREGLL